MPAIFKYPQGHPLYANGGLELVELIVDETKMNILGEYPFRSPQIHWAQAGGYQRPERTDSVAKYIKGHFNPNCLGVPLVSRRADDTLWWIDGQGRSQALFEMNIPSVLCWVYDNLTLDEEKILFETINLQQKQLSKQLAHQVAASREGTWNNLAQAVMNDYKLFVGDKKSLPKDFIFLSGASALARLWKEYQRLPEAEQNEDDFTDMIRFASRFVTEVYPEYNPSATVFYAAAHLYKTHQPKSMDRVINIFKNLGVSHEELCRKAGGSNGTLTGVTGPGMADAMNRVYNNIKDEKPNGSSGTWQTR